MWKAELMVERAPEVTYALSVRIMASFARRRTPAAAWSVDDASTFAAQKEFKLLQLLSTDKKAFATARRLGLYSTPNRNCSRPQDLVQLRRRPRHADGLMQHQGVRSVRIAARSAVPSEAHGITRNCRCSSTAPLSLCCTSVVSGGCVEHGGYRHV